GWELARPARRHEPAADLAGDCGAEDEASCFGAEHDIGPDSLPPLRELVHGLVERDRIAQKRRDVAEDDSLLRPVRDVANALLEVDRHQRSASCLRSCQNRSCESSWASSARFWSSSSAACRRSGFRERSDGATICSSRPALRSAAVRNVRRCRAEIPYRESFAQVTATSTSRSP